MLGLTGTTGKIGGATLDAILQRQLCSPSDVTILTSSSSDADVLSNAASRGIRILQANYNNVESLQKAVGEARIDNLFLVSTPAIDMDFNDAPVGSGRERHHMNVIDAAVQSGVKHITYTSLAFQDGSQAGVMRAHFRTEAYLGKVYDESGVTHTILRMGLYNESWPLYLGHYKTSPQEEREEIIVAGDGDISWTSVADLGLAIALLLCSPDVGRYRNPVPSQSPDDLQLHRPAKVDPNRGLKGVRQALHRRTHYGPGHAGVVGIDLPQSFCRSLLHQRQHLHRTACKRRQATGPNSKGQSMRC